VAAILPWLEPAMRYGGAGFLAWYAARSLSAALRSSASLRVEAAEPQPLVPTLLTCLALTWLNPHVYLDTVVLLGTISTRFPGAELVFAAGAICGSFLFFFALGYGAAWLRPLFARPLSWRILDALIAAVMALIALRLVAGD
jgi:L-lysine exporter family protein LysE/ArgO